MTTLHITRHGFNVKKRKKKENKRTETTNIQNVKKQTDIKEEKIKRGDHNRIEQV